MSSKSDFTILFNEQYKRLVKLACRLGLTVEQADEIVQESFAALWEKILKQEAPECDIAFLLTVVKNNTFNALKRRGFERRLFVGYVEQELTSDEFDSPEKLESAQAAKVVSDAVVKSHSDESYVQMRRDCVNLKIKEFGKLFPESSYVMKMQLDGIEVEQIARAIQRTAGATRTYLVQIRRKLKPYLAECR